MPVAAIRMALFVAGKCSLMNSYDITATKRLVAQIENSSAGVEAIDRICRTALNARKQRKLK